MIEKADVVVLLFQRLDDFVDELVQPAEQFLDVLWYVEIHADFPL
jgi:hypothetical protein